MLLGIQLVLWMFCNYYYLGKYRHLKFESSKFISFFVLTTRSSVFVSFYIWAHRIIFKSFMFNHVCERTERCVYCWLNTKTTCTAWATSTTTSVHAARFCFSFCWIPVNWIATIALRSIQAQIELENKYNLKYN